MSFHEHSSSRLPRGKLFGVVDPARSALMSRIRAKNSKPELAVRKVAHALGYRFRLHYHSLPGTPDLVFPRLRTAIFVHGCFWHRHRGCRRTTQPKTRAKYWSEKFEANVARDARKSRRLRQMGWHVFVVWECQTLDARKLAARLQRILK